ncbi:MAG TPA: hypothetical protein V6C86_15590 [Oculatellaceae cyanobacterium]
MVDVDASMMKTRAGQKSKIALVTLNSLVVTENVISGLICRQIPPFQRKTVTTYRVDDFADNLVPILSESASVVIVDSASSGTEKGAVVIYDLTNLKNLERTPQVFREQIAKIANSIRTSRNQSGLPRRAIFFGVTLENSQAKAIEPGCEAFDSSVTDNLSLLLGKVLMSCSGE